METWSTHDLFERAELALGGEAANSLVHFAQKLIAKNVAVVFTLGHLSNITGVGLPMLRETILRKRETLNYKMFAIKKRTGGRRFIHAVSAELFRIQRFINSEILQKSTPHPSSFAFHKNGGIRECARRHCGAKWIFQFDLSDFFFGITELDANKIFRELGYPNLLAFELSRLCTTTHLPKSYMCVFFAERV